MLVDICNETPSNKVVPVIQLTTDTSGANKSGSVDPCKSFPAFVTNSFCTYAVPAVLGQ